MRILISVILFAALTACSVGPNYVKPKTETPAAFKEARDWKQAQPKDTEIKGKWWEVFNDPELNKLEDQVEVNNQNVKAAEAAYRQAKAVVSESRAGFFPTISGSASTTRGSSSAVGTKNQYIASLDANWEPDVWGRIRRIVEAGKASEQASAADLGAAKLSAQATLATDYLALRIADEQKRLLDETVNNYERSLKITKNLYDSGVNPRSDYLQAKTQLESAQAQAIDIGATRAQLEHGIAILIGKAPADFSLAPVNAVPDVPKIPVSVPSQLLERRPDIAGSERRVAVANAQIGVAESAFFPNILLSASGGFQSSSFADWFSIPNRIWSVGPSIAETIFDAGLRRAQTKEAIAVYDQTVANYRQTVLSAFQEVEDNLASLRILGEEHDVQRKAVKDAEDTSKIILNQYKAGIVSYLNVVTVQNTELSNKLTELNIRKQKLVAAATLIKALGGGWKY